LESSLYHLQLNVRPENLQFYRDLTQFLGYVTISDQGGFFGTKASNGASLWFIGQVKDVANDYDGPGLNHIGIGAQSQADVDATADYLREMGIATLFETPRHRPEFSSSTDTTYYQVMFESPDRLLFEVVYTGPK
jgi:catechol 2,3-dioxygenase-like lactoylglutathione lyase family enzyme